MTIDVVGFGALNLDRLYKVNRIATEGSESYIKDIKESCGGSAANTIIGLARLGIKTAFIGKIATDREGKLLIENLHREGVETQGIIEVDQGRSGSVLGFVDGSGERALYVDPGVNDHIKNQELNLSLLEKTQILHITSFVGESMCAQEELMDMLPKKVKVSLDPGRIYAEKGSENLSKLLKRTNILLINQSELKLLTDEKYKTIEERIDSLKKYEIKVIVVKLGEEGCYASDGDNTIYLESYHVDCQDTTGAGDAFNAGFLYGQIKGNNLEESCMLGNYAASCCIKHSGGTKGLPNRENLEKFFKIATDKKINL